MRGRPSEFDEQGTGGRWEEGKETRHTLRSKPSSEVVWQNKNGHQSPGQSGCVLVPSTPWGVRSFVG